jgi:DNA-directed RNA polymerase subunit RPC12/RpoP
VDGVRCPRCGQRRGRRCARSGGLEHALSFLYVYPFRCQDCGRRFRALQWGKRYVRTNRRDYERVAVHLPATVASREGMAEGEVTDLSLVGCGVKADLHPVAGDQVTLRVRLTRATRPVEITAAVRSVHTGALGLEFTGVSDDERERLRHFLAALVVTDGGRPGSGRPGGAGRSTRSAAAVGLIALVALLGAFLILELWSSFRVCVWGQTC